MIVKKRTTVNAGIGPMFALFLVLLVLKLTEVIAWSWWWITLPLWWPAGLVFLALIGAAIAYFGLKASEPLERHYRKLKKRK